MWTGGCVGCTTWSGEAEDWFLFVPLEIYSNWDAAYLTRMATAATRTATRHGSGRQAFQGGILKHGAGGGSVDKGRMEQAGWFILGGALGVVSLLDPLGLAVSIIVLAVLIGLKLRSAAPGLLLAGAGTGATVMLELLDRSYPGAFPFGVSLSVSVVVIGCIWASVIRARARRQSALLR